MVVRKGDNPFPSSTPSRLRNGFMVLLMVWIIQTTLGHSSKMPGFMRSMWTDPVGGIRVVAALRLLIKSGNALW